MKCVLIVSSGEMAEGASELHRMGYELELYPSTRDLSSLKDTREKESAAFIGREPCSAERSHVRSLRASFIQVLEDRRYAGNDLIIFGESDAVPMVASSRLEAALRKEMEEHPETDIFRLFHHAVWSPQGNPFESDELLFEDFKTGGTDSNTAYVWDACHGNSLLQTEKSHSGFCRLSAANRCCVGGGQQQWRTQYSGCPSQFVLPA